MPFMVALNELYDELHAEMATLQSENALLDTSKHETGLVTLPWGGIL